MKPIKWILGNSKKQLPKIIFLCFISAVSSVCYIGLALFSKSLIDIKSIGSENYLIYGFYLLLIIVFQVLLYAIKSRLTAKVSGKLDISFKENVFNKFTEKTYSDIKKYHSGEVINRLTSDIDIVISLLVNSLPSFVGFCAKIIVGIVVLIIMNTYFGLIILATGSVIIISGRILGPKYKSLHKACQKTAGIVRSFLQECVQNIVVIKTFLNKASTTLQLNKKLQDNYNAKLKRNSLNIFIVSSVYLLFSAGYYGTLVWGAYAVSKSTITFGTLLAFLQIISQIRSPLYNVSGIVPQFYSAVASAERLIEFENLKTEETDNDLDTEKIYNSLLSIEAKDLSFCYEDQISVIKNSNFKIKKGAVVSVTGESGAGKSTLFKLLLGLYEKSGGSLNLNLENRQIAICPKTRKLFSYVPQGNLILSGSIKDNIMFGNNNATEEDFISACKVALVDEFAKTLPNGYDTYLGERGDGLSEGQIQRIAIARAVLSSSQIILFDECTSALDEKTEKTVLENIKNQKNKTLILISHKPATLEICTDILSIENGYFTAKHL